jgi:hypothetical protein
MTASHAYRRAVKHSSACAEGLVVRGDCEGFPHCYVPVCAVCRGPLPTFPAFVMDGGKVTGPYCDEHAAVSANAEQGSQEPHHG